MMPQINTKIVHHLEQKECLYLEELKKELHSLYTPPIGSDVYQMIDGWRNELMHGNKFWIDRVPILLNVICLLVIDEIEPAFYDSQNTEVKKDLKWLAQTRNLVRAPWDIFPP